jgi:hypothetical protein
MDLVGNTKAEKDELKRLQDAQKALDKVLKGLEKDLGKDPEKDGKIKLLKDSGALQGQSGILNFLYSVGAMTREKYLASIANRLEAELVLYSPK